MGMGFIFHLGLVGLHWLLILPLIGIPFVLISDLFKSGWGSIGGNLGAAAIIALLFFVTPSGFSNSKVVSAATVTSASNQNTASIEKNNYHLVRSALSASEFIDDVLDTFEISSSTQLGLFTKIATKATQGVIYAEDWIHTDKEIERRINEILSSPKLANAADNLETYDKFKQYAKTSLKNWIPDRDYPRIGYLPKELLFDKYLGEEITKYWPKATAAEQAAYVALTVDNLLLNYELIWNDLLSQE